MDPGRSWGEGMSVAVNFADYSKDGRSGYAMAHQIDGVTKAVLVTIDQDGKLRASSLSVAGSIGPDSVWHELEAREPAIWVHSMLTGRPSEALLDILGIPHVDRADVADEIFEEAGLRAKETLPGLDERALSAMAAAPEKRLSTYEFYAVAGDRGLYRCQAAGAFPVFADLLNSNLSTKMAIDRKKPLAEILAPILSEMAGRPVGNALLKRFSNAPALPEGMKIGPIIEFASHVQPDWFPKSPEEWTAFYTIAWAVLKELGAPADSLPSLLSGSGGKWVQLVDRAVAKAYPDEDDPARSQPNEYLKNAAFNAQDTLEAFTDMVVLPLISHAQDADEVYLNASIRKGAKVWGWDMLFEGRNLPDLLDISRRFHQERAGMLEVSAAERLARAKSQVKTGGWPGLTAPVQAPNGFWLVPLCTPEELREEGSRMRHCVGTYSSAAKQCTSHIVSVRSISPNGNSVSHSTCEYVGITSGSPKLHQRQHQADRNTRPDAPYLDAMDWYKNQIETGRLKVNWELIRAFLDDALVVDDPVERICGYDWRDRQRLDQAVRPWGPFVTKAYRTKGLDSLMDSDQAKSIISGMTPAFLSAHSM